MFFKGLVNKNHDYLRQLSTEKDKMQYEVSFFDWEDLGISQQSKLERPVYDLANDDFLSEGIHNFECNIFYPDHFNDHYIVWIAEALKDSKKAKKVKLHYGRTRDAAMQYFLNAVQETKAPLETIDFDTVSGVTDNTWKLLPDIIKSKGIIFNLKYVTISDKVKDEIEKANQSVSQTRPQVVKANVMQFPRQDNSRK